MQEDSYFLKPETGSLAHHGWYKDNRGQNFCATTCLLCGTVHTTRGNAPHQVLFGNPLRVDNYFTYEQLQEIVFDVAHKNSFAPIHAFNAFAFPDIVINALRHRGYLGFLEKQERIASNESNRNIIIAQ